VKVLQVINKPLIGGAEKVVRDLCVSLNSAGIQTDVLFLSKSTSVSFFDTSSGYGIIYPKYNFSIYNPLLIFYLIKHVKKYDIINVHLFPSLYFLGIIKMFFLKKKSLIFTEHSTNNRRMNNIIFKFFDQLLYKYYNRIVTISNDVDISIKSHLDFNENKFLLIKNGIDLNVINNTSKYSKCSLSESILESDFLITQVSSFQYPKDHFTLIDSLAILPFEVKCIFVGDGVDRLNCEKYVVEKKLNNRIFFLGKRTDVYEIMKTSDVLVLSSKYEGMPISCLEGMASNKPFIGTNVPGIREIVRNHGLLFEFSDSIKLSEHILKLYNDINYYKNISHKCFIRSKDFDISNTVSSYISLYKSLDE
jgi:glycosyltransferase involved in cell wall biosynthesis